MSGAYLGHVINAMGKPVDGRGKISWTHEQDIRAPSTFVARM
jgi:F0F1-type ATP synthase alpha subunit